MQLSFGDRPVTLSITSSRLIHAAACVTRPSFLRARGLFQDICLLFSFFSNLFHFLSPLEIKPRTSYMLGNICTIELQHQPKPNALCTFVESVNYPTIHSLKFADLRLTAFMTKHSLRILASLSLSACGGRGRCFWCAMRGQRMCSGSCFLIFPKYVFCAWALLLSSFISFVLFSCTDTTLVLVLPGTFSFQLNH